MPRLGPDPLLSHHVKDILGKRFLEYDGSFIGSVLVFENLKMTKSIFDKNISEFRKHDLHLAQLMENYEPPSDHVIDEQARAKGQEKVRDFLNTPSFLKGSLGKPDVATFDRYGVKFARNMEKYEKDEGLDCPQIVDDGETFYLFIFGVGPGLNLGSILKKFKPTVLVVVEPEPDHLYDALHADDWQEFIDWQKNEDTMFFYLNDRNAFVTAGHLQTIIRGFSPAAFGHNPYFIFAGGDFADAVLKNIFNNPTMMLEGIGFMYDETLMLKNSYLNLGARDCNIFRRVGEANLSTPVFVIGAGPSLDADLEFIQQHSDQAIIISTGTALRSLLVNGITPDFHVELENIHVYSSIIQLSREFDLSPICLLVSNAIDPHIIQFFEKVVYYHRPGVSPYPLFCTTPDQTLCNPGPLVVNASFSLAIDLGAKDIFLIGTDFGSRGTGSDHAKDNVLYTDEAIIGYVRQYDVEIPANFSGRFLASEDFILGLQAMTKTILLHARDRNIYNCSDGARIEGATPMHSSDARLTGSAQTKTQDLQAIYQRFAQLTIDEFEARWNVPKMREWINGFCDFAIKIFGTPEAYSDSLYLTAFTTLSRRAPRLRRSTDGQQNDPIAESVAMLFRGTLDMVLAAVRYYLNAKCNPAVKNKLRKKIASEMTGVIESMRSDALAMLDDPTDIPPAKESGEWDAADFVQEAYYTWGKTPRNANCPCGSGKRYKHCHGLNT